MRVMEYYFILQPFAPYPYHNVTQLPINCCQQHPSKKHLSTQNQETWQEVTKAGRSIRRKWRARGSSLALPLWCWSCACSFWASLSTRPPRHSAAAAKKPGQEHVVFIVLVQASLKESARILVVFLVVLLIPVNSLNSLYSVPFIYVRTSSISYLKLILN